MPVEQKFRCNSCFEEQLESRVMLDILDMVDWKYSSNAEPATGRMMLLCCRKFP